MGILLICCEFEKLNRKMCGKVGPDCKRIFMAFPMHLRRDAHGVWFPGSGSGAAGSQQ